MTDLSDDETFAAEYALGTLDATERAAADERRRREPSFESLVEAWEARLSPLAAAAAEVTPPPALLAGILSRLPPDLPRAGADNVVALRRRLRTWRGVAAVAGALAAMQAIWIVSGDLLAPAPARQTYVAVLQHGADTPSFVVSADLADRRMMVMPLAVSAPPDKSYELWVIGPDKGVPQSMGLLDPRTAMRPRLPDLDTGALSNATYAVTLEPHGGSPTGQPTSTPIYVGKLIHTSL